MIDILLLTISLCIDSFVASIAYGTNKIKIPFLSALIIDITCSLMLGSSLILGAYFKQYLTPSLCKTASFLILFSIGIYRLFESLSKNYIKRKSNSMSPLKFKVFDFNFVLQVYADETKADFDKSKVLTSKESFYLAIALSLDSIAVGFGSSFLSINYIYTIISCLILGLISIIGGVLIGSKCAQKFNFDISWLSGALLICLSILKL